MYGFLMPFLVLLTLELFLLFGLLIYAVLVFA